MTTETVSAVESSAAPPATTPATTTPLGTTPPTTTPRRVSPPPVAEELVKVAIVGTGSGLPLPPPTHPIESWPEQAATATGTAFTNEDVCLLRAGLTGQAYRAAGPSPRICPPLEADAGTDVPLSDPTATAILVSQFDFGYSLEHSMLPELLDLMVAHRVVCPYEHLPAALNAGIRAKPLRPRLRPILGSRGRWLASLNPAWRWGVDAAVDTTNEDVATLERIWNESTSFQRTEALATVRTIDPELARTWLERDFAKEKVEARVELLKALRAGLSDEDLPFLETAQSDRAASVRQAARDLAARLPTSPLVQRMIERSVAIVTFKPGGPLSKATLDLKPPKSLPDDWKADGIVDTLHDGLGKRASICRQVLEYVPLSVWTGRFGLEPAELVAAALAGDEGAVFVRAWTQAVTRFADTMPKSREWVDPLWHAVASLVETSKRNVGYRLTPLYDDLIATMPRESFAQTITWATTVTDSELQEAVLVPLLTRLKRSDWTPAMAQTLLRFVRQRWSGFGPESYTFQAVLLGLAVRLPPEMFAEGLAPFDLADEATVEKVPAKERNQVTYRLEMARRLTDQFHAVVADRMRFHAALGVTPGTDSSVS